MSQPNPEALVYRFRKQRGVNLGAWFVLEKWITNAPFRNASTPAQSDLDIARGHDARAVLEAHYDTWVTESDWAWISDRGLNTVRIPIGYYHLCGIDVSVISNTDFAGFADVFSGVWDRLIRAIETAHHFGLGVLLDLHAAPGKQNNDAHAGTSNAAKFLADRRNRVHTVHVLRTLVTHLNARTPRLVNIVGIELLNEPIADAELMNWYSGAIKDLAALDPTLPIYLSDSWKTEEYAEYIKSNPHPALLVLDHHLAATPASDHSRSLTDESAHTPRMFARVAKMLDAAGAGFVVGEWSGALNPGSLTGSPDEIKNYVEAQLRLYEANCSGYFFWTYKKAGPHRDRGWCLRDAVDSGVFPSRSRALDTLKNKALDEHTAYWSKYPGKYQHARFAKGFALGWEDAYTFFASGPLHRAVSELGFIGARARTKTTDHGFSFWEFQHGFRQGVDAARSDFWEYYCSK